MAQEQIAEGFKPFAERHVGNWPQQDVTRAYFAAIGEVMRAHDVQPPDVRESHTRSHFGVQTTAPEHVIAFSTEESLWAYQRLNAQVQPFLDAYARQWGVDRRALEGARTQDGTQILTFDGMSYDEFRMSLLYQRLKRHLSHQWETSSRQ